MAAPGRRGGRKRLKVLSMKINIDIEANDDGRSLQVSFKRTMELHQTIESEDDFNKYVDEIDNRLQKIGAINGNANVQDRKVANLENHALNAQQDG